MSNDPELDPNRPADPPTKAIEKPVMRHGKRDGSDAVKPIAERNSHQTRAKQTDNANDNAFRDRGVGSDKNRGRGSGEPTGTGARGGQRGGRGRGGRGGRGGREGDRHSRTGIAEHEKQAAHGWGGNDGDAELADEQAGEAIAHAEEKDAVKEDAEAEAEAEPEDKSKSYTAYLAELAEKKLSLGPQNVRKPNEGSSKKFPEGTALAREEQEDFMAGSQGKAKRERARKEKE
ncbi:telomere and ribosome associated stm1 [Pyrenophora seminiperda CCB06]|uniref:Telomere and ribosome associated stm1 n=1 Tax=Pyrenophora seminiperda CCB06 TaxID=1302712 RepID=A0A3M7M6A9_9PLEO|nr:telomere and ribosome associated stm1 [Pyrenophora seminiperda CCB06]